VGHFFRLSGIDASESNALHRKCGAVHVLSVCQALQVSHGVLSNVRLSMLFNGEH
jgi:hypothetical protein